MLSNECQSFIVLKNMGQTAERWWCGKRRYGKSYKFEEIIKNLKSNIVWLAYYQTEAVNEW